MTDSVRRGVSMNRPKKVLLCSTSLWFQGLAACMREDHGMDVLQTGHVLEAAPSDLVDMDLVILDYNAAAEALNLYRACPAAIVLCLDPNSGSLRILAGKTRTVQTMNEIVSLSKLLMAERPDALPGSESAQDRPAAGLP
jgi:hypothetical protein